MLTPQDLENLSYYATEASQRLQNQCVASIARRLAAGEAIKNSDLWRINKLSEIGALRKELLAEIKKASGVSIPEIRRVLSAGLKKSRFNDSRILKDLGSSTAKADSRFTKMVEKLSSGVVESWNVTATRALQASTRSYINAINTAYYQTSLGTPLNDAVRQAVEEVGKSGIKIVAKKDEAKEDALLNRKGELHTTYEKEGKLRTYPLDAAIRRDIVTQTNHAAADLTLQDCEALGCGLVETSWHNGARPEHEVWQGKVFSLDPKNEKYGYFYGPLEQGLPAYGDPLGICGINCYHSFSPYVEGQERSTDKNKPTADENAKAYEEQQQQRAYERELRALKREHVAQKAAGYLDDAKATQGRIRALSGEYSKFLEATGRTRVRSLEGVDGYRARKASPLDKIKTPEKGVDTGILKKDTVPENTPLKQVSSQKEATYPVPETLKEFDAHQKEYLEKYKSRLSLIDEKRFKEVMNDVFERGAPSMRIDSSVIDVITSTDGRFKTQFETGTSKGVLDLAERDKSARQLFGVKGDIGRTNHEKYGCILDKDFVQAYNDMTANWYGDSIVQFKKEIYERSTFTIGDSLNPSLDERIVASRVNDVSVSAVSISNPKRMNELLSQCTSTSRVGEISDYLTSYDSYIELQFHGDVTLKDVEAVCFMEDYSPATVSALKNMGIRCYQNYIGTLREL